MDICIIGAGYVGLVTGACLADLGNKVICVDNDKKKIEMLKRLKAPFYEKGLEAMIKRNVKALPYANKFAREIVIKWIEKNTLPQYQELTDVFSVAPVLSNVPLMLYIL